MNPGLHKNVPAEVYHRLPGASASRLKTLARSPAHCRHEMDHPAEPTDALVVGTALHCLVLEPGEWQERYTKAGPCEAVLKSGDRKGQPCGKAGSAFAADRWWCGTHAPDAAGECGRIVLAPDQHAAVLGMARAVNTHPAAALLLGRMTHTELTALWTDPDTGVACKMRADALCDVGGTIVLPDLKTTDDASEDGFWRAVEAYRYDLSACHYLHGLAAHGVAVDVACLVMVEKKPPHAVGVYEIPTSVVEAQEEPRRQLLARWAECERSGEWPAYSPEIQSPAVPAWFARRRGISQLAY